MDDTDYTAFLVGDNASVLHYCLLAMVMWVKQGWFVKSFCIMLEVEVPLAEHTTYRGPLPPS
jgi:hypothetical protein